MTSIYAQNDESGSRTGWRSLARQALSELLQPLVRFVLESGLSVREFHDLTRQAAVRSIASRHVLSRGRINISGIAASTGLTRAEVSRILHRISSSPRVPKKEAQATNRILGAWYQDPRYASRDGDPQDLKIFGRSPSFEALVKKHGGGIPARALLDELLACDAVEILPNGFARAKLPVAISSGLNETSIRLFGEHVTELLNTLLANKNDKGNGNFVARISEAHIPARVMPLIRKEISSKGSELLSDLRQTMGSKAKGPKRHATVPADLVSVAVTLFCTELAESTSAQSRTKRTKRQNLKRQ